MTSASARLGITPGKALWFVTTGIALAIGFIVLAVVGPLQWSWFFLFALITVRHVACDDRVACPLALNGCGEMS